ncbi:MAG: hypothetical protein HY225_03740 [Candidatus Vogelbacteria bacterium]|nr:hypothetical protein [Candidatus Vogelbacteria bacterium]
MNEKYLETVRNKQEEEKQKMIEVLKEAPVIAFACKKIGIGRSTYYRWIEEDEKFKRESEEALQDGTAFVIGIGEVQLFRMVKEGKMPAISFLLRHRHAAYGGKPEKVNSQIEVTTPEQDEIIRKAMESAIFPSIINLMTSPDNLCQTS